MLDQVPRKNEGKDYTLLGHPYLVADKWSAWQTSVDANIKYATLSLVPGYFLLMIFVVFTQIL
jgi:hypothetical protein